MWNSTITNSPPVDIHRNKDDFSKPWQSKNFSPPFKRLVYQQLERLKASTDVSAQHSVADDISDYAPSKKKTYIQTYFKTRTEISPLRQMACTSTCEVTEVNAENNDNPLSPTSAKISRLLRETEQLHRYKMDDYHEPPGQNNTGNPYYLRSKSQISRTNSSALLQNNSQTYCSGYATATSSVDNADACIGTADQFLRRNAKNLSSRPLDSLSLVENALDIYTGSLCGKNLTSSGNKKENFSRRIHMENDQIGCIYNRDSKPNQTIKSTFSSTLPEPTQFYVKKPFFSTSKMPSISQETENCQISNLLHKEDKSRSNHNKVRYVEKIDACCSPFVQTAADHIWNCAPKSDLATTFHSQGECGAVYYLTGHKDSLSLSDMGQKQSPKKKLPNCIGRREDAAASIHSSPRRHSPAKESAPHISPCTDDSLSNTSIEMKRDKRVFVSCTGTSRRSRSRRKRHADNSKPPNEGNPKTCNRSSFVDKDDLSPKQVMAALSAPALSTGGVPPRKVELQPEYMNRKDEQPVETDSKLAKRLIKSSERDTKGVFVNGDILSAVQAGDYSSPQQRTLFIKLPQKVWEHLAKAKEQTAAVKLESGGDSTTGNFEICSYESLINALCENNKNTVLTSGTSSKAKDPQKCQQRGPTPAKVSCGAQTELAENGNTTEQKGPEADAGPEYVVCTVHRQVSTKEKKGNRSTNFSKSITCDTETSTEDSETSQTEEIIAPKCSKLQKQRLATKSVEQSQINDNNASLSCQTAYTSPASSDPSLNYDSGSTVEAVRLARRNVEMLRDNLLLEATEENEKDCIQKWTNYLEFMLVFAYAKYFTERNITSGYDYNAVHKYIDESLKLPDFPRRFMSSCPMTVDRPNNRMLTSSAGVTVREIPKRWTPCYFEINALKGFVFFIFLVLFYEFYRRTFCKGVMSGIPLWEYARRPF